MVRLVEFRRTRGRLFTISGSEVLPRIYKSNKVKTKTVVSRVDRRNTAWKPQPHWPMADWRRFVEPAKPGEDQVPYLDPKCFHTSKHTEDGNGGRPG